MRTNLRPFTIKPPAIGTITLADLQALYAHANADTKRRHRARIDAARFDRRPDTRYTEDNES